MKYQKILLLLILITGFFLRLVNLQSWFHFEFDEEVIAWKLRPFLQEGRPFLIGGGTPFGFHLGPAFYYLSAIPLFFSGLDPIGWGVMAAIFGAATIWLMWLVGKNLYGRRVGLIAALMWATSFTAVMSDRHWWPLVLDPMLSLLVILLLYKIEKFRKLLKGSLRNNGTTANWVWLGLVLAFGWQADLTVLPLFLAAGVVAVLNFRRQWKGILAAAGILLVSVLPLLLFELRHPGANLGKFLQRSNLYSLQRLDLYTLAFIPQSLSRLVFPITNLDGNLLNFYTWCREIAGFRVAGQPWWVVGMTTMLLIIPFVSLKFVQRSWILLRRTKFPILADKILRILILSGVFGIALFRLGGGNLYDFYLAVLYPVVLILAARSTDFIWRKWGVIAAGVIMVVIVGLNLTVIANVYHPQGLAIKREAVEWTKGQLNGREFELDSLSGCSRYNGVRYLFFLENMEPAKSFVDQDLSWLYPSYDEQSKPEYLVTFSTPNDLTEQDRERYRFLSGQAEAKRSFGDLEVLITKIIYE